MFKGLYLQKVNTENAFVCEKSIRVFFQIGLNAFLGLCQLSKTMDLVSCNGHLHHINLGDKFHIRLHILFLLSHRRLGD